MSAITAIGTANPVYKRAQMEIVELITSGLALKPAEKRLLKTIYKSTGIDYRYSVLSDYCKSPGEFTFFPNKPTEEFPSTQKRLQLYKENALRLVLEAVEDCCQVGQTNLDHVTHIVTVSCTGMYAPGLDIELIHHLKLNSQVQRTAINFMGCYGAFNGLKVANAICQADSQAKVLLVCVELCTIHFQKSMNMDNVISNAIFADGASALLIESPSTQQKYFDLRKFHCDLLPQSEKEMTWHIGDQGFDIALSTYVPEIIERGIETFAQKLLPKNKNQKIDFYAIHPGGSKILQACEKALNISSEDNRYSYKVLRNYGNMSSVTVPFVLKTIWNDIDKNAHQKNIFSCAFGPGLTLESMMLGIHDA